MADKTIKLLLVGEDKSASKALKGVGDSADNTGGKLNGMKVLGAAAMAGAALAVLDFGKASVQAFRDASKSQRELEDAYGRFPSMADVNIEKLRELNAAVQAKTGADADDIASGQAVMAQYGLTGKQVAELTPLLDDYAVKTGKDMKGAAEDLGKAMLGQGRALKGVGIDFVDTGSVAGNFDQVMAGLRTQVGGFAESEGATAEGQLRKLTTEFEDVQETVGEQLLPVLVIFGQKLLELIGWVKEHETAVKALVVVIGVMGVALTLLAMSPMGLVVTAIAALVAGLIIAYNTSETFRNVVNGAFTAIGNVGRWLWNEALAPAFRSILGGFAGIMDGLAKLFGALGKVPGFGWARDAADAMRGAADKARDMAAAIRDIKGNDITIRTHYVSEYSTTGKGISGSGPVAFHATGGPIRGAGTGTSDSNLIRASNGEYIFRAAAARQIGERQLDYMNATGKLPRFAGGGAVGGGAGGGSLADGTRLTLVVEGQPFRAIIREENRDLAYQRARKGI